MRITLGVTGGVAAYKAAELVRRLQQEGFSVEVVMTRAACEFITPLTFAALTGKKVITGLFAESGGEANLESAIEQTKLDVRHYAKRQLTWFRREAGLEWIEGFGDDPRVQQQFFAQLDPFL